jgi:hypothetical protein
MQQLYLFEGDLGNLKEQKVMGLVFLIGGLNYFKIYLHSFMIQAVYEGN